MAKIMDDSFVEYIIDAVMDLQGRASSALPALHKQLAETERGITNIDMEYWPDEIRMHQMIYQYICVLEDYPFIDKTDIAFPFLKAYSDSTWEAFRSCIQYGEYREISPLDFTLFISSL